MVSMVMEVHTVRFFWGPRREEAGQVAKRLLRYLKGLLELDPVFDQWYPVGKNPDRSVPLDLGTLEALCRKGISRGEIPPFKLMEDLGFAVNLLTGGSWMLWLRVHGGVATPYVPNSLIMDLPPTGVVGRRVHRVPPLIALCRLVVQCWGPEVGQIWSAKLSEVLDVPEGGIDVGWLTYIARQRMRLPELDKAIEVIPIARAGHLIVSTRQRFSTDNANHLVRATRIAAALNGASGKASGRQ
jgi:hypothetical protein